MIVFSLVLVGISLCVVGLYDLGRTQGRIDEMKNISAKLKAEADATKRITGCK